MGPLSTYYKLRTANPQVLLPGETPLMPVNNQGAQQPSAGVQPQQPQIDTSDPINSLAGMLVTPAEREAKQQRLLENKRRMIAWTGLFEGLRQLGNLYYTSKGASPQTYTNNPAQAIEQGYQQELKNLDDIQRNRQAYAQQIWSLRRQASEDARKDALSAAQAKWYGSREETEQQKAELDRLKAVRVIKQKDGSLLKFDPVSGSIEPLSEADPLYVEWMNVNIEDKKAKTKKTLSNMGGGSSGNKVKKTVKQPIKNSSSSGNSKKTYDNTRKLGL